jgi:hypothetical protein
MSILVITHKNCPDGLSAFCVIKKKFYNYNVEIIQVFAGSILPDIENKYDKIYITDLSFSKNELIHLCQYANQVFLYDHHKTALDNLGDWHETPHNLTIILDMNYCGAIITWQQLFPDLKIPSVLEYVNDRDLWLWQKKHSKEINLALSNEKYFEHLIVDHLFQINEDKIINMFFDIGSEILKKQQEIINNLVDKSFVVIYDNLEIHLTENCPDELKSEIGEKLSQQSKNGIGGSIQYRDNQVVLSLRALTNSDIDLTDCIKAKGHKKAAGLSMSINEFNKLFIKK